jgi:hypothetical protein
LQCTTVNINLYLESEEQTEQVLNEVDQASRLVLQEPSGMGIICELTALESCFHILHYVKNQTTTPYLLNEVVNIVLVVHSVTQVTILIKNPVIFNIAFHYNLCNLKYKFSPVLNLMDLYNLLF